MILSKVAISRPVTTWVLIIALVLLGGLSYFGLPVDLMPSVDIPVITVQVIYPGAGSEEIENNITKKIEDEVYTISGIDEVSSYVMEGGTLVVCKFNMDKNVDIANQEIKDKIDAISNEFPDDALKPSILKMDINATPIVYLSFISTLDNKESFTYVENNLKDELARINGVSQVQISGGQEREIHLVFNEKDIQKYNLSPLQLISIIKANNLNMPGGNITQQGTEYSVKVDGEFSAIERIGNLKISTPRGEKLLSEIVKIEDSSEKMTSLSRFFEFKDGKKNKFKDKDISVISLEIKKQSDANTVAVAETVVAKVKEMNKNLPENMQIAITKDKSTFVRSSVDDTLFSIFLGILLTSIILYLFLHGFKTTFIVGMSMPVVLIGTFILISGFGFSVNMMTLMALSVSVGTLVTNSVVILENIDRYIRMGMDKVEASDKGTAEIAVAVLASTLTNIVVFIPIATMESISGQFFKEFGLTVTFIMIFSIIVSFTVTPMLSSKMLDNKKENETSKGFGAWFDKQFNKISYIYRKIIEKIVTHWYLRIGVSLLTIGLLLHSILILGPKLGSEFVPFVDNGDINISIEMPTFYNLDKTASIFKQVENIAKKHSEIESISTNIGKIDNTEGPYLGYIKLKLKKNRKQSTKDLGQILSEELAGIPGALIKVSAISQFSARGGSAIQLEVSGEDSKIIEKLAKQLYKITLETKGTINVDTDIRTGKPEIKLLPIRNKLKEYNLTINDIGLLMRTAINGMTISKYRENGKEYDIVLKSEENEINDIDKIKAYRIITPKGYRRIDELCNIEFTKAPTIIKRKNKLKMNLVSSDASGRTPGTILAEIQKRVDNEITIPEGYFIKQGGDAKIQAESNKDFSKAFIIAIILTFLLIAAILESWLQATLIMFTIPMSFIGVFWSLYLMNVSLNIFSMMAAVMLIGIVVNNAIIVFDYANVLRNMGHDKTRAILEACQTKLKAILMATLAAILGMLPLALGLGDGAELRQGLGIVSVGGLIVSALLTLFVIPALYVQFQQKRKPRTTNK